MKRLPFFGLLIISVLLAGLPFGSSTKELHGDDPSIQSRFAPDSLLSGEAGAMVQRANYKAPSPSANVYPEGNCVALIYNGDPDTKLDVVFVASHFYTETGPGSKFADDVDLVMGMFLGFPQYADNVGKMNFYRLDYIDPEDDCHEVIQNPVCYDKVKLRAMASQCTGYDFNQNDQVIVMFDHETTNLSYARAEPGFVFLPSDGWAWSVHEFGHSFGGLGDEYPNGSIATIDPPYPNCASANAGFTCSDKWGDLMGQNGVGCFQACGASNWYRPTSLGCVMNHPAVAHHCAVCSRHVDSLLTVYIDVPVFVRLFVAVPVEGAVELVWDLMSDEEVKGFRLYRKAESEQTPLMIGSDGLISADARTYTDRQVHGGSSYEYTLGVVLGDDSEVMSQTVTVKSKAYQLVLHQNHPNPFNPSTTISFTLPKRVEARLTIHNVEGRLVTRLVDDTLDDGFKEVTWDGKDSRGNPVSSGVYFYRLIAGDQSLTKKMVLLK